MTPTGAIATLLGLGVVFAVMLGGPRAFNSRRARTRVRSAGGPNLASIIAVIGVAALLIEAGGVPFLASSPSAGPLLALLAVVLVVGTVVAGRITPVITALLGVGLLVLTLGPSEAITLVIISLMLLWLLGLVRGWSR